MRRKKPWIPVEIKVKAPSVNQKLIGLNLASSLILRDLRNCLLLSIVFLVSLSPVNGFAEESERTMGKPKFNFSPYSKRSFAGWARYDWYEVTGQVHAFGTGFDVTVRVICNEEGDVWIEGEFDQKHKCFVADLAGECIAKVSCEGEITEIKSLGFTAVALNTGGGVIVEKGDKISAGYGGAYTGVITAPKGCKYNGEVALEEAKQMCMMHPDIREAMAYDREASENLLKRAIESWTVDSATPTWSTWFYNLTKMPLVLHVPSTM